MGRWARRWKWTRTSPGVTATSAGMSTRSRERKSLEQSRVPLPRQATLLAATAQPLKPDPLRRLDEQQQTASVAVHAEVVEVAPESPVKRRVLVLNRQVPMAPASVGDGLDSPSETRTPCLALHAPPSLPGALPIQGEPQKVEGGRTLAAPLSVPRTPDRCASEWNRPSGSRCARSTTFRSPGDMSPNVEASVMFPS